MRENIEKKPGGKRRPGMGRRLLAKLLALSMAFSLYAPGPALMTAHRG